MKIVILGGGSAGWLASLFLISKFPNYEIVSVESSDINPIGVGEATTGKFTQMLEQIGIDMIDFIKQTNALPKHSIRLVNWTKQPGQFDSPVDYSTSYRQFLDQSLFLQLLDQRPIEYASQSGIFSLLEKTSFRIDSQGNLEQLFPAALQFDAGLVVEYLKKKAIERGVTHIVDTVTDVVIDDRKNIIELQTTDRKIVADLYIDCTGFSRTLIGNLSPKMIDNSQYINVNSAMLFRLPKEKDTRTTMMTIARKHGWNFEISTRNRIGRGYLFNKDLTTTDELIEELSIEYQQPVEPVRLLDWKPSRPENVWIGNTIAIGLSASFQEPLQAGSIHHSTIQLQDLYESGINKHMFDSVSVMAYNRRCQRMFNDFVDFVGVSYASDRDDSKFWKFVKYEQKLTERAKEILAVSQTRLTRDIDFDKFMGFCSQGIYNYTLAGLGHFDRQLIKDTFDSYSIDVDQLRQQQRQFEQDTIRLANTCLSMTELNNYLRQ
jgi:glycine/D-amino acid oxidase-like deaminating enzyme